jgi:predicted nucleotidyltransferase component of viral defense system
MKNHAASVMAKLKDKMRATKEPLNFLLLQYVQERFLYRLSLSEYKEQYILKGGTLFYVWAKMKYRPTKDLDFMFYGKLDRNALLKQLIDVCRQPFPEDGIDFQWDTFSYEEIKESHEYDGVRIHFIAKIGTALINMKLDICTGDKITPSPKEQSYPTLLSGNAIPKLKVYPKETVIAEKVHAMISLDLPNSRMKDFFDVFILIADFSDDIEYSVMVEAIRVTFNHRHAQIPDEPSRVWTGYFYNDENKQRQWSAFIKRNKILSRPTLKEACLTIADYINPVFNILHQRQTNLD